MVAISRVQVGVDTNPASNEPAPMARKMSRWSQP